MGKNFVLYIARNTQSHGHLKFYKSDVNGILLKNGGRSLMNEYPKWTLELLNGGPFGSLFSSN